MTVYRTLLARGYFPKELPPAFFTDHFAWYATTQSGRSALATYGPQHNSTECTRYQLALPGLERRPVRLPHPLSMANLAGTIAGSFKRLIKLAARSQFSRSRPIYAPRELRALRPATQPSNLGREKILARAGSAFLVRVDISQFYPSLYTHAVGWSVDPSLRDRANWGNRKLLGKKIDQALMDLQGKVSQGIPIGTDLSFLLGEIVLSRIDRALPFDRTRAYRWFDDYEIACDSREEGERILARITRELDTFRLRINPHKTGIVELPEATEEDWRGFLFQASKSGFVHAKDMVAFFDVAFRSRNRRPKDSVLVYALGLLFKLTQPKPEVARVAQSCITQAILSEPGSAQKAFALLAFWAINGVQLDVDLLCSAITRIVERHEPGGTSSDVAWALAFSRERGLQLGKGAGKALSNFDDDVTALLALDLHQNGQLPGGYSRGPIEKLIARSDLDGEHWLLAYESNRLGFVSSHRAKVAAHSLFADMIQRKVGFYRTSIPTYAMVVHMGGAPSWVVHRWIKNIARDAVPGVEPDILTRMREQVPRLPERAGHTSADELILGLQNAFENRRIFDVGAADPYWG